MIHLSKNAEKRPQNTFHGPTIDKALFRVSPAWQKFHFSSVVSFNW